MARATTMAVGWVGRLRMVESLVPPPRDVNRLELYFTSHIIYHVFPSDLERNG
jgi:hypothetical protein